MNRILILLSFLLNVNVFAGEPFTKNITLPIGCDNISCAILEDSGQNPYFIYGSGADFYTRPSATAISSIFGEYQAPKHIDYTVYGDCGDESIPDRSLFGPLSSADEELNPGVDIVSYGSGHNCDIENFKKIRNNLDYWFKGVIRQTVSSECKSQFSVYYAVSGAEVEMTITPDSSSFSPPYVWRKLLGTGHQNFNYNVDYASNIRSVKRIFRAPDSDGVHNFQNNVTTGTYDARHIINDACNDSLDIETEEYFVNRVKADAESYLIENGYTPSEVDKLMAQVGNYEAVKEFIMSLYRSNKGTIGWDEYGEYFADRVVDLDRAILVVIIL